MVKQTMFNTMLNTIGRRYKYRGRDPSEKFGLFVETEPVGDEKVEE